MDSIAIYAISIVFTLGANLALYEARAIRSRKFDGLGNKVEDRGAKRKGIAFIVFGVLAMAPLVLGAGLIVMLVVAFWNWQGWGG